jgi:hypothetical protein
MGCNDTVSDVAAGTEQDAATEPGPTEVNSGPPWPAPGPDPGWWDSEPPAEAEIAETVPGPAAAARTDERPTGELFPLWPAEMAPAPVRAEAPTTSEPWPAAPMRIEVARRPARTRPATARRRVSRPARRPVVGLAGLLLFGLLAGFLAWVSAEPFWLAVGHGTDGTATVSNCTGHGVLRRCIGDFTASGGRFRAKHVAIAALPTGVRRPGATGTASMVSARGRIAYAGDSGGLNLRWLIGFGAIILSGLGIAWITGAARLADRRARLGACLASVGAPILLLLGMLGVTY